MSLATVAARPRIFRALSDSERGHRSAPRRRSPHAEVSRRDRPAGFWAGVFHRHLFLLGLPRCCGRGAPANGDDGGDDQCSENEQCHSGSPPPASVTDRGRLHADWAPRCELRHTMRLASYVMRDQRPGTGRGGDRSMARVRNCRAIRAHPSCSRCGSVSLRSSVWSAKTVASKGCSSMLWPARCASGWTPYRRRFAAGSKRRIRLAPGSRASVNDLLP